MPRELSQYVGVYGTLETLKFYARTEPQPESVPVAECYGRVLAEDAVSPVNIPTQHRSRIDGFGVRSEEVAAASDSNRVKLSILKREVPSKNRRIAPTGCAYQIAAGESLRRGFDAVLPIEDVEVLGNAISVIRPPSANASVARIGAEVKKKAIFLKKGTRLRVQEIGLLTSFQMDEVSVFRIPRVAILPIGTQKGRTTRRTATAPESALAGLVAGAGGRPLILETVRPDSNALAGRLGSALVEAEIVLAISDPSEAEPDAVETAINSFGKPGVVVHGVRIHPGRVMGFGMAEGKPVIIVPRSTPGAINAFIVFAYPLIQNLLGQSFKEPPEVIASLNADWQTSKTFQNYTKVVYVSLRTGPDGFVAQPLEADAARLTIPLAANAYLLIPETLTNLNRGTKVWAHLLPGFSYLDARFL